MRAPLVAAAALASLAARPAAALGSTAKVVAKDSCNGDLACSKYNGGTPLPIVTHLAGPGEANRVAVARTGAAITISDPGAAIAPEAPCQAIDPHQVTCTAGSDPIAISGFDAQLGDGDDALTIAGSLGTPWTVASGRSGDGDSFTGLETVLGGAGADRLLGGPGPDVLRGGPGGDILRGAGGDDTLSGELGADSLGGGAGADLLDGDPPQGDGYYTPIIKLRRDVLRGGSGSDQLSDTGGANVLSGGSGDDLLRGGAGADRLLGGSGADRISARDGLAERVACGSGRDTARIDAKDRVRGCENLRPRRYTSQR